jgi:ABC-2 type transport system ATP-binding protein
MRELTKHYPVPRQKTKRVAVDKLNLNVPVGTIFGFLGPNGAGKTTTIKVLLGFTAATAGSAWIFGKISSDDSARSAIGYVPEQPYFHKFLTAQEIVRCHGALAGFGGSDLNRRAAASLETVEMAEHALTPLSKLSKGMTQRIALASALVGDPKLLILDEPSSGLDPLGRKFLRDLLLRLRDEGKTIFLSSHLLSEMEEVCDHVGILARGKLVAAGKPSEIVEARDAVAVDIETPERDEVLANTVAEWGGQLESGDSGAPRRVLVPSAKVYSLIELLEKRRARLVAVVPQRESLEDAFVRLVSYVCN